MERSRNIFILLFFIFIFMDSICNEVVSFRFLNHLFLLANHLLISMQGVESSPSCRTILVGGCSAKSAPLPTFYGLQLEGYLETSAAASNQIRLNIS